MADINEERRRFIVNMMRDAWKAYVEFAWPHDMLRPVTKDAYKDWFGPNSGETVVNAMSTLWVMGLKEEFDQAQQWVAQEMHFEELTRSIRVFQIVGEYIGGLLSCHALTGDKMFLDKANQIALLLKPAYRTMTGLPYEFISPKTGARNGTEPYLSYLGTGLLEYPYLSQLTGDAQFKRRADIMFNFIRFTNKPKGLFPDKISSQSGAWCSENCSLFGATRDYIGGLVKRYVQSGRRDMAALTEFRRMMDAVEANGLITTSRTGLVYGRNFDHQRATHDTFMNQTGCYLGAALALDAVHGPKHKNLFRELLCGKQYGGPKSRQLYRTYQRWQCAKQLTETCHQAAKRSATGLLPRNVYFDFEDDATNSRHEFQQYFQRPEIVESYFILYRLTHDERYREHAWHLAQSIERHCHIAECGFVDLLDANTLPPVKGNIQYPEFLGATLKYLYLIFCDDSVLPLDKWIFNSTGQPLPITQ